MKTKPSVLLIGFMLLAGVCFGQTNSPKFDLNWGHEINGVRLSISLTNDPIMVGSNTTISAQITNNSTNLLKLFINNPFINDFSVYLTDDSNNKHTIVQPSGAGYSVSIVEIGSKENRCFLVLFKIGNDIRPGDYLLSATKGFRQAGAPHTLESNAIRVHVR